MVEVGLELTSVRLWGIKDWLEFKKVKLPQDIIFTDNIQFCDRQTDLKIPSKKEAEKC